jgi:type IX secretion system PorP/SprF family membrane protein
MRYSSKINMIPALRQAVRIAIISLSLSIFWGNRFCYGQQHPIFTQYMFNGLVLNPAYSGSHEAMTLTASFRSQWTGIKGAPQTEVFSAHSPIQFSRSAAGLLAAHDRVGVTNQYTMFGTYAYHIPVSKRAKISVGAQAGGTYHQANYNDLNVITQTGTADAAFAGTSSRFLPNLGIGAYYYSKTSYVGLSLPTLINNKWEKGDPLTRGKQERHYFLTGGHVFNLNDKLMLKPNILLKWVEDGPFQYDLNVNLLINKVVWVGVSYRMQDSIDGIVQWNISDQMTIGYSYGFPTSALSTTQSGTHEMVVSFPFYKNKHIIRSPRYF